MSDSEQLVASPPLTEEVKPPAEELSFIAGDILLRFFPQTITDSIPPSLETSPLVMEAMQKLIDTIAKLHQSDSGWSPDLPYTPEHLAPYVSEEAYDVLDALAASHNPTYPEVTPFTFFNLDTSPLTPQIEEPEYRFIADFSLKLLWYIARSSYELMQLIEGVPAKLSPPNLLPSNAAQNDSKQQSGILRLVVSLQLQAGSYNLSLDLVTHESPVPGLPLDSVVNINRREYSLSTLKQRLLRQIETATPEAKFFIDSLDVEFLIPGENWQIGKLYIQLDFEFVADEWIADEIPEFDLELETDEALILQLADQELIAHYQETLLIEQLAIASHQLTQLYPQLQTEAEPLLPIVERTLDVFQAAIATSNLPFAEPQSLTQAIPLFLWHLTRTSSEIMQLLGGIKAYIHQPEWGWYLNSLRLTPILTLNQPKGQVKIDLATGQTLHNSDLCLSPETMIQPAEGNLSPLIDAVENLLGELTISLESQLALNLFLSEISLKQLNLQQTWIPGSATLSLAFILESSESLNL